MENKFYPLLAKKFKVSDGRLLNDQKIKLCAAKSILISLIVESFCFDFIDMGNVTGQTTVALVTIFIL